jgi:hypothetical protein
MGVAAPIVQGHQPIRFDINPMQNYDRQTEKICNRALSGLNRFKRMPIAGLMLYYLLNYALVLSRFSYFYRVYHYQFIDRSRR